MTLFRCLVASLLLSACGTGPATGTACSFDNEASCSDEGTLVKVCAGTSALSPTSTDYRWRDAPRPSSPNTSCGCFLEPARGSYSAWCTTTQVNEGNVCVTPTADRAKGGAIAANQPLNIHVSRPGCLSGSCSRDIVATCNVQRTGNILKVTSFFSASEPVVANCTLDCRIPIADCMSDPLPDGQYTLVMGSLSVPVTVPSTVPDSPCIVL
jgi:hypothetical protein